MSSDQIFLVLVSILVFEFLFSNFLEFLNFKKLNASLPPKLQGIYDDEKYQKSIQYQKESKKFDIISGAFSFFVSFTLFVTGVYGWFSDYLIGIYDNPIIVTLLFFGISVLINDLLSIPFELYDNFVIEQKFGFNKMTVSVYIADKLKSYLVGAVVGGSLLVLFLFLIKWMGANFWWIFWIVAAVFMVLINMFYTSLIVPLFNKLTPLEEGELKNKILEYCNKVNFPVDNLYVIDGSKRSTKANAYFSGIGKKKKIVLYDTLIKDHTTEELVAVLAHEVGHFKKKHVIYNLIIGIAQVGFMLWLLSLMIFNENLSIAYGASQYALHLNLLAFSTLYTPISTISGLLMMVFSRKNEYEADAFAKETYSEKPLILALKKLTANSLGNLTPHPWYVFFNYSHPTLLQRIEAMEK
jgi:STE24 endopeptidase